MMKRFISAFILVFFWLAASAQFRTPSYSDLQDGETISALRNHISYIASMALEGRAAGSEGETDAAVYVGETLGSYGVDLLSPVDGDTFGMKRPAGDTLVSRNVIGFIPGYDPALRDRYIVIGARLDNIGTRDVTINGEVKTRIYNGANGNASGLAMMLELAKRLQLNSPMLKRSVLLVAFGSSLESFAGSWYFLNRSFKDADKIDAMINLDILGTGNSGFYAYTSANEDMSVIVRNLKGTLQPVHPELTLKEPFPSDHRAFYDKEIPSILFSTGSYPEYGSDRDVESIIEYDMMERELEYIYNYSIELINGQRPVFNPNKEQKNRMGGHGTDVVPYYDCDYRPTFLGSNNPETFLKKWVYAYLRYPEAAVAQGLQGRVLVDFVIDEKGKVTNVQVLRGVHDLLDDEAVRVISASPDWKPGRLGGKKVKSEISVWVDFRLKKKK